MGFSASVIAFKRFIVALETRLPVFHGVKIKHLCLL